MAARDRRSRRGGLCLRVNLLLRTKLLHDRGLVGGDEGAGFGVNVAGHDGLIAVCAWNGAAREFVDAAAPGEGASELPPASAPPCGWMEPS